MRRAKVWFSASCIFFFFLSMLCDLRMSFWLVVQILKWKGLFLPEDDGCYLRRTSSIRCAACLHCFLRTIWQCSDPSLCLAYREHLISGWLGLSQQLGHPFYLMIHGHAFSHLSWSRYWLSLRVCLFVSVKKKRRKKRPHKSHFQRTQARCACSLSKKEFDKPGSSPVTSLGSRTIGCCFWSSVASMCASHSLF